MRLQVKVNSGITCDESEDKGEGEGEGAAGRAGEGEDEGAAACGGEHAATQVDAARDNAENMDIPVAKAT